MPVGGPFGFALGKGAEEGGDCDDGVLGDLSQLLFFPSVEVAIYRFLEE